MNKYCKRCGDKIFPMRFILTFRDINAQIIDLFQCVNCHQVQIPGKLTHSGGK